MQQSETLKPWAPAQQARLEATGVERSVDVHCHVLPGLDDGPATMDDALALCDALVDDGVTTVMATPHQLGRYDRLNSAAIVRSKVELLAGALRDANVPLEIFPGGDVRIDERLARLLAADEICTLADRGRHVLLELPHELLVDPSPTIEVLVKRGVQPIMTHPERHRYLDGRDALLQKWVDLGAVIQLTAGSVLGEFGRRSHHQAWKILDLGLASLIATDAHDAVRRPPRMTAALRLLDDEMGAAAAHNLCAENPLKVLHCQRIEPPSHAHGNGENAQNEK